MHPDKLRYHKNEIQNIGRKKMEKLELIAPCHFGLEAVLKREIQDLGYEIINVEDGRVTFAGDASAICRANFADRGESAAEGWKFQSSDV